MKNYIIFSFIIALMIFTGCSSKKSASLDSEKKALAKINEIENSDKIVWLTYDEAAALSKYKPKKIFVDVYTNWCGWCKRMEATTFQDPNITKYVNQKFYAVKLNAESNRKLSYKDKEVTEVDLARDVFQATGYPTTVYLSEDQSLLQPVPGYLDVDMLNKILHFYGEDAYKTTSWDRFRMSYNPTE